MRHQPVAAEARHRLLGARPTADRAAVPAVGVGSPALDGEELSHRSEIGQVADDDGRNGVLRPDRIGRNRVLHLEYLLPGQRARRSLRPGNTPVGGLTIGRPGVRGREVRLLLRGDRPGVRLFDRHLDAHLGHGVGALTNEEGRSGHRRDLVHRTRRSRIPFTREPLPHRLPGRALDPELLLTHRFGHPLARLAPRPGRLPEQCVERPLLGPHVLGDPLVHDPADHLPVQPELEVQPHRAVVDGAPDLRLGTDARPYGGRTVRDPVGAAGMGPRDADHGGGRQRAERVRRSGHPDRRGVAVTLGVGRQTVGAPGRQYGGDTAVELGLRGVRRVRQLPHAGPDEHRAAGHADPPGPARHHRADVGLQRRRSDLRAEHVRHLVPALRRAERPDSRLADLCRHGALRRTPGRDGKDLQHDVRGREELRPRDALRRRTELRGVLEPRQLAYRKGEFGLDYHVRRLDGLQPTEPGLGQLHIEREPQLTPEDDGRLDRLALRHRARPDVERAADQAVGVLGPGHAHRDVRELGREGTGDDRAAPVVRHRPGGRGGIRAHLELELRYLPAAFVQGDSRPGDGDLGGDAVDGDRLLPLCAGREVGRQRPERDPVEEREQLRLGPVPVLSELRAEGPTEDVHRLHPVVQLQHDVRGPEPTGVPHPLRRVLLGGHGLHRSHGHLRFTAGATRLLRDFDLHTVGLGYGQHELDGRRAVDPRLVRPPRRQPDVHLRCGQEDHHRFLVLGAGHRAGALRRAVAVPVPGRAAAACGQARPETGVTGQ